MRMCVSKGECTREGCVCVCDSDSNCSSPLLQKLLAWSALSQSEGPAQKSQSVSRRGVEAGPSLS